MSYIHTQHSYEVYDTEAGVSSTKVDVTARVSLQYSNARLGQDNSHQQQKTASDNRNKKQLVPYTPYLDDAEQFQNLLFRNQWFLGAPECYYLIESIVQLNYYHNVLTFIGDQ